MPYILFFSTNIPIWENEGSLSKNNYQQNSTFFLRKKTSSKQTVSITPKTATRCHSGFLPLESHHRVVFCFWGGASQNHQAPLGWIIILREAIWFQITFQAHVPNIKAEHWCLNMVVEHWKILHPPTMTIIQMGSWKTFFWKKHRYSPMKP